MARARSTRVDWYPVMTRPNQEQDAENHLKRQGILTFLPKHRVRVRRKVANKDQYVVSDVERAYFRGYMFVGLREGDSLYTVNNTPSVATVVYNGDVPLAIPPAVMKRIMFLVEKDGIIRVTKGEKKKPEGEFPGEVGDNVKILEGPFASFIGHISSLARYDSSARLKVWLTVFERPTEVELEADQVQLEPKKCA